MKKNQPVDARVRLAISRWPQDAPRGSVTTFCAEHDISRKTFYAILARAREEGPAAALEPRSRRPKSSPTRISDDAKQRAIDVRAALEASGLDYGPISVHDKMRSLGMTPVPSIASLARIFREKGVARAEPSKRPRSSYRRFVYPAPNACWQLDATEYVLARGRKCVMFQLEDDHSRVAVASHVAAGETAQGALAVMRKGIAARGVPQRLLSDNGIAINPSRRGYLGQLVAFVTSLGVLPITSKPRTPRTQGKNERFHQTLFKWLNKQPLAETFEELQEQIDQFDHIYNTQRPHQGLPGRMTPQQAWDKTPAVDEPWPSRRPAEPVVPVSRVELQSDDLLPGSTPHASRPGQHGHVQRKVRKNGQIRLLGIEFRLGRELIGKTLHLVWDPHGVAFAYPNGEVIALHRWPPEGVTYISNNIPRSRPSKTRTVTEDLRHEVSPKS